MIDASQSRFRVQGFNQLIVEKTVFHLSDENPVQRPPSSHKDASTKPPQRISHVVIDVEEDHVQAENVVKPGTLGPSVEEPSAGAESRSEPNDELDAAIGEMKAVADLVSQLNSQTLTRLEPNYISRLIRTKERRRLHMTRTARHPRKNIRRRSRRNLELANKRRKTGAKISRACKKTMD
jgi:hypothetical protein